MECFVRWFCCVLALLHWLHWKAFPSVRPHVALQITRSNTREVALVTLVWFIPCVLSHHVPFQITSSNTGILAHCASVRLFSRVGLFVILQVV